VELRQRLLLSLCGVAALLAATAARAELPALRALIERGAAVTALVVDLQTGQNVEQLNAAQRLAPASLTKLVTAGAVLDAWPVDKTFDTALVTGATLRDGVLAGDLILQGGGDATLDEEKLWSLAAQLRDLGVREVTGRLLVRPAGFGTLPCETRDRCMGQERTDRAYNALLSSIGVDFGNWCLVVRPGVVNGEAALRSCSGTALPIPVDGRILTGREGSRETLQIERVTGREGDRLRVSGSVAVGPAQRIYRAMADPALGTGQLLGAMLRQMGVRVSTEVAVTSAALPPSPQRLAEVEGLQLREQVGRMMRYSNNYIADVLTLNLAAERAHATQDRLSTASNVLLEYLLRDRKADARGDDFPILASGSGLTPENRLSARDLAALLARQYRDTRRFPAFYGSLVVPREAPFSFLRRGGPDWLDRVALKTGSMNEPYSVGGVAGYLRRRDGGWMAFAVIVNGSDARRQIPLGDAIGAAREDLEGVLARY
jgi:D-alanyl-D-alanine carboxypeptidase/D-alanyl-D-alanine-endopeptidase (penicillin-binding protein 4)